MTQAYHSCGSVIQSPQEATWDSLLLQLGPAIKVVRQRQSLTLRQLHYRTQIPIYHLVALEQGDLRALPTPVYMRGFLNRICNALGEEGKVLLEQLPKSDNHDLSRTKALAGTPKASSLKHRQLYWLYTAVLLCAVSYTVWLVQRDSQVGAWPEEEGVRKCWPAFLSDCPVIAIL